MKKLLVILTLCVTCFVSADDHSGSDAALKWLHTIDNGKYVESWHDTDKMFKDQLSSEDWDVALKSVRSPLGEVVTRAEFNYETHSSFPGIPEGEYVVIQYKTEFRNMPGATETLTFSKASGQWRAIGYYIQ